MKRMSVYLVLLLSSAGVWAASVLEQSTAAKACQCNTLAATTEPESSTATMPVPKPFVIEKVVEEPMDYNYSDDERLADKRFSVVYNMPLWVKDVATLCPWQSKSNDQLQGYIRLVHGQFNDGDRLYAQWIKRGTSGLAAAVLSTRELGELNQQKMTIQFPKERIFTDFCELTMAARGYNGQQYRLELKLSEPGQYRLNIIRRLTSE